MLQPGWSMRALPSTCGMLRGPRGPKARRAARQLSVWYRSHRPCERKPAPRVGPRNHISTRPLRATRLHGPIAHSHCMNACTCPLTSLAVAYGHLQVSGLHSTTVTDPPPGSAPRLGDRRSRGVAPTAQPPGRSSGLGFPRQSHAVRRRSASWTRSCAASAHQCRTGVTPGRPPSSSNPGHGGACRLIVPICQFIRARCVNRGVGNRV